MRRQGSSRTAPSCVVLERRARLGREQPLERQPVEALHLVARGAVAGAAEPEDARRDHQVHRTPARHRLHVVERPERLGVARQVEACLLARLAHGGRLGRRVGGLRAAPGKPMCPDQGSPSCSARRMNKSSRPGSGAASRKTSGHGRARAGARDLARRVSRERRAELEPGGHVALRRAPAGRARGSATGRPCWARGRPTRAARPRRRLRRSAGRRPRPAAGGTARAARPSDRGSSPRGRRRCAGRPRARAGRRGG